MKGVKGSRDGALPRIPVASFLGLCPAAKPPKAFARQCRDCESPSWSGYCNRCSKRYSRENFLFLWGERGLDRRAILDALLEAVGYANRNYDWADERQAFLEALDDDAEPEVFRQILSEGGLEEIIQERDERTKGAKGRQAAATKARWAERRKPVPALILTPAEAQIHARALLSERPKYPGEMRLSTNTLWRYQDEIQLQVLCIAGTDLSKASAVLGRSETSIVHRAKDAGMKLPKSWWAVIPSKPRKLAEPRWVPMAYPYVSAKRAENAQVLEVNELVARYLPGRADICQEILLALWEKRVTMEQLRKQGQSLRSFVRQFYKSNHELAGYAGSLDAEIQGTDGLRLIDTI